jgi:hypothetical protein
MKLTAYSEFGRDVEYRKPGKERKIGSFLIVVGRQASVITLACASSYCLTRLLYPVGASRPIRFGWL